MSFIQRRIVIFSTFFFAIVLIGLLQSWNVALGIFNLCLISATMALVELRPTLAEVPQGPSWQRSWVSATETSLNCYLYTTLVPN